MKRADRMNAKKFFRDLGYSFVPDKYPELVENKKRDMLKHFFLLLLLLVVISSLLYIPQLTEIPGKFEKEFSKFENFTIGVNAKISEPVDFGLIKINTIDDNATLEGRGFLITNIKVESKLLPFGKPKVEKIEKFSDITSNAGGLQKIVKLGVIFITPYLFILIYVYHAIKYLITILLVASLIIITIRTAKGKVDAPLVYKSAFYGSVFLMLELFIQPYNPKWTVNFLIPLVIYIVFVLICTFYLGSHQGFPRKKEKEAETVDIFSGTSFSGEDVDIGLVKKDIESHRM